MRGKEGKRKGWREGWRAKREKGEREGTVVTAE